MQARVTEQGVGGRGPLATHVHVTSCHWPGSLWLVALGSEASRWLPTEIAYLALK